MSTQKTKDIFGEEPTETDILRSQAATLMVKGAAYGAVVFVGIIVFLLIFQLVGSWLPPESKEMPDPNILQRGAIEAPLTVRTL